MASGPTVASLKHLRTLFQVGTVSGLSDGQLLDLFVQRRDADAFAALVDRHGPMVLRVCQGRLGQIHDAEDAFQATFLVLARRAPSIRKSEAVAGWLLGVAGRVAAKAWSAARRRSVSERTLRQGDDVAVDPRAPEPWTELYDLLDRLPEKYRLPLVLCYLEGLTYEQAASRLGCPVRTVQTRLARGRERLRRQLSRRDLDRLAVLLAPPRRSDSIFPPVPAGLKEATINLAQNFGGIKGPVAVTLAKKVCRGMFLSKVGIALEVFAVCAVVVVGRWAAWLRVDAHRSNPPPDARAQADDAPAPEPSSVSEAGTPREECYITGFVRDEKTGAPVAGARVRAHAGIKDLQVESRDGISDGDGRFSIAVPVGNVRLFLNPPSGYWLPEPAKHFDFLAVSRDHPVQRKDFPVRRGTLWRIRLTRGPEHGPVPSGSIMQTAWDRIETDTQGYADLTLPGEAGEASLLLWGSTKLVNLPKQSVKVRWDAGFRPDAVQSITRHDQPGQPPSSRLTDDQGRTAVINGAIELTTTSGRLVMTASLADAESKVRPASTGTLTGTVIDHKSRPVADAQVIIFYQFRDWGSMSDREEHWVRTDTQGKYTIPSVPRKSYEGDPTRLSVVVYKAGFVGVDSPVLRFWPGDKGVHVIAPLRLEPGIPFKGTVVDPDRQPVVGAEIRVMDCWATGAQTYRSGADGRFLIPHVNKGVIPISINWGPLSANGKYVVDGNDELTIQLRPRPDFKAIAAARSKPVQALKTGQPAAPWNVTGWTDGESRTLADFRGKVVALEFWGIWCGPCVNSLSFVDSERQRFSERGVVFLSIHTPGDTLANIRKLYALKKVSLVSAVDDGHENDIGGGTTASAYGIRGYPTFVLIDRAGTIAFRSDDPAESAGSKLAGAIEKLLAKP
jgi:RNA polymerase sigma factor (sigma-70 family)